MIEHLALAMRVVLQEVLRFHLHEEIILEGDEADDGEEVDENDRQDSGQQDGPAVSGHRLDDVEQGLLSVDHI